MNSLIHDFNEFANFCLEHGNTLRNHKTFIKMYGELEERIRMELELAKFEIAKLELKKGDALIFRYTGDYQPQPEDIECLVDSIRFVLPVGVKALIMDGDIEVATVRKIEESLD